MTLTAQGDPGFRFTSWGGDCLAGGTNKSFDLELAGNAQCTATFEAVAEERRLYVIGAHSWAMVNSDPEGIELCAQASGYNAACEAFFPHNQVVSFDVVRTGFPSCDSGLTPCFEYTWSDNCAGGQVRMDGDQNCVLTYEWQGQYCYACKNGLSSWNDFCQVPFDTLELCQAGPPACPDEWYGLHSCWSATYQHGLNKCKPSIQLCEDV